MPQSTADPIETARGLQQLIIEQRDETEVKRQVAEPVVDALIDSRLGRMALSVEQGGLETSPVDALAVFEILAEAEASVAWITWNSSLPCWFARFLEADTRAEIFSGSDNCLYASSTRPSGRARADGEDFRISGRWSLVSGCMHARWIPVMCLVEEDGEVQMLAPGVPHMRMFFVPRETHEILDTWYVGGLRGTGSHDSVLDDVTVSASRSFAMGAPSLMDSPHGRMPIFATMSAGCASICLGIAQKSLDALIELGSKVPVDGGPGLRDRAPVQSLVARVDTMLGSLRAELKSACGNLWHKAESGESWRPADIGALLTAAVSGAHQCRAAVSEIYAAAGTSSLYTDSPIERAHRDIYAVTQHIALQPFWLEQAGRVKLGLEPSHPLFTL